MVSKTAKELAKIYRDDLDACSINLDNIYEAKRLGRIEQYQLVEFIQRSQISKKNASILFKVSYASVMNWFSNVRTDKQTQTDADNDIERLKQVINTFIELGGDELYQKVKERVNQQEYHRFMEQAERKAKSLLDKDLI